MEQIKLEIQKLYKALDKLETRCDKIQNLKVDQNAEDKIIVSALYYYTNKSER